VFFAKRPEGRIAYILHGCEQKGKLAQRYIAYLYHIFDCKFTKSKRMVSRPFSNADPFLQLLVLFLLCFMIVGVFMLMAQGLIIALWGINVFTDQALLRDYDNIQVVHINRLLLLFQHLGLFIVPAIIFSQLTSRNWKKHVGLFPISPALMIAAAAVMVLCLPLINALSWINNLMSLPEFLSGLEAVLQSMEEGAAELTVALTQVTDVPSLLLNIVIIALIPAIGEEMIFRGLMIPIIRKWTGSGHLAVWISAFLFSAIHLQFYGFLPRLILGALLGYLFLSTKSLYAPIIAHFVNNALALVLLFLMARGTLDAELDSFVPASDDLIWLGISIIGIVLILGFIFRKGRNIPQKLEKHI